MKIYDTVIVGAGILGLSIARELLQSAASRRIAILEKEPDLGRHGSGRNSGVLHSGIYYPSHTLKAKLCAQGAAEMHAYCIEKSLPLSRIGKVILPLRAEDDALLDTLHGRAAANGASAEIVDVKGLAELEPAAFTMTGRALWSPGTSVVDPKAILTQLAADLHEKGVDILYGHQVTTVSGSTVTANGQQFQFGTMINAAGLHADVVARSCGVGSRYVILPFKGLYFGLAPDSRLKVRRLIYPVPDLRVPFLGVHFTKKVDGEVFLGPTAIPAFGRENYRGMEGVNAGEFARTAATLGKQYLMNKQGFRTFVHAEGRRFLRRYFLEAAQALVPSISDRDMVDSDKVGIRAQLFDKEKQELVMDFLVERGERSVHVLNAVSPGFTSAFTFARIIVQELEGGGSASEAGEPRDSAPSRENR